MATTAQAAALIAARRLSLLARGSTGGADQWVGDSIPAPLTDARRRCRRAVVRSSSTASRGCACCATAGRFPKSRSPGNLATDLAGAGARWTEAQLRGAHRRCAPARSGEPDAGLPRDRRPPPGRCRVARAADPRRAAGRGRRRFSADASMTHDAHRPRAGRRALLRQAAAAAAGGTLLLRARAGIGHARSAAGGDGRASPAARRSGPAASSCRSPNWSRTATRCRSPSSRRQPDDRCRSRAADRAVQRAQPAARGRASSSCRRPTAAPRSARACGWPRRRPSSRLRR